jgi:hypothetical protein
VAVEVYGSGVHRFGQELEIRIGIENNDATPVTLRTWLTAEVWPAQQEPPLLFPFPDTLSAPQVLEGGARVVIAHRIPCDDERWADLGGKLGVFAWGGVAYTSAGSARRLAIRERFTEPGEFAPEAEPIAPAPASPAPGAHIEG